VLLPLELRIARRDLDISVEKEARERSRTILVIATLTHQ
jgi:hypothetical protein